MGRSNYYLPVEERERLVLDNPRRNTSVTGSKVGDYLAQENVKTFNTTLVSHNFERLKEKPFNGHYADRNELMTEVTNYFKLCEENNIIPTISTLCLYTGISRETLYANARNNTHPQSDIFQSAINTCHAYNEVGALNEKIPSSLFQFLATNYYGLHNTQQVDIRPVENDTTINNNQTLKIIQEQLSNELE